MAAGRRRPERALKEFDERSGDCDLSDPEEKHPLDHLGLGIGDLGAQFRAEVGSVLLGHEPLREVFLLLAKGHFEALRNGASLGRFDAGCFEDREDFDPAHEEEEWWKV